MSYRVRRIDPYWIQNPVLPVVAVLGVVVALVLFRREMTVPAIIAGGVSGVAVFLSTRPSISAVLATLGFIGGATKFLFLPNAQDALMSPGLRLLSTILFTLFYMVLMDGIVVLISALYNVFAGGLGLGGITVDLEDVGSEGGA